MKRHEIDYFSLAAGLLFVILGIVFAVSVLADWTIDGRWVVPVMLIVLGAGGVLASLAATRRERAAYDRAMAEGSLDDLGLGGPGEPFA